MKDIIFQDLDGVYRTGSEKDVQRVARAHAIRYGKAFITIDERHMDQRISVWHGNYAPLWAAFGEALDHLIDAGEIYCAILSERDEDGNESK